MTRAQALEAGFGDNQDTMLQDDAYVHHSVISPNLNIGLLDPVDTCRRVVEEWQAERAPGRARSTCHTGITWPATATGLSATCGWGPVCRAWDRMAEDKRTAILAEGDAIIGRLSAGEVV